MAHRALAIGPFFRAPPFCEDDRERVRDNGEGDCGNMLMQHWEEALPEQPEQRRNVCRTKGSGCCPLLEECDTAGGSLANTETGDFMTRLTGSTWDHVILLPKVKPTQDVSQMTTRSIKASNFPLTPMSA